MKTLNVAHYRHHARALCIVSPWIRTVDSPSPDVVHSPIIADVTVYRRRITECTDFIRSRRSSLRPSSATVEASSCDRSWSRADTSSSRALLNPRSEGDFCFASTPDAQAKRGKY